MLKHLKLPNTNILSLAIIALLLFIPLYPKFPLLNVPGTYVAVRIEDFLVAGALLIWFLSELRQGFPSWRNRVSRLILLYWGIGGLAVLSAVWVTKNVTGHIAFLHWLRRVEYMSLFFVAFSSLRSVENLKSYGVTLFLTTIGVVIYGLGQKFFNWPVISTMNPEFSKGTLLQLTEWARINSTFAGHYDLAAFLVLTLALTAGFVGGLQKRRWKIIAWLVGLASFYLLILTASRVSFVAYLVAILLVLLGLRKYFWVGPVLGLSILAMLFSSEISRRYALTFNIDLSFFSGLVSQRGRVEKIVLLPTPTSSLGPISGGKTKAGPPEAPSPTPTPTQAVATGAAQVVWKPTTEVAVEYSSGIRFHVEWPRAIRAFLKNPFLGTGYSSVTLATDNDYLRLVAETGLLGFAAFWLIFLEIGRRLVVYLQKAKPSLERALVISIASAAIGLFANAVFIDVFEASKVAFTFWIWMGILVGTMELKLAKEVNEKEV